jgi:uncharacterized protein YbjT (DUF2867 family)
LLKTEKRYAGVHPGFVAPFAVRQTLVALHPGPRHHDRSRHPEEEHVIIVTGATGKIGQELVKLLASTSTAARAVVRDPSKLANAGIEVAQGDLDDPASLDRAFEGANHLLLLAATTEQQVRQERNAIEAARRARFHHVVKISALGASADSPVQLGRWHAEIENHLKQSGIGWTILQPHYFCQNLLGQAATIRAEGAIYGSFGEGKVPFVDVRDIAMVAFAALTQPGYMGRTFVLTGGHAYTHAEAAESIGKAIGKTVRYVDLPAETMLGSLQAAGMPQWYARDLVALMSFFRTGAAAEVTPTIAEITRKTARTVEDFARDYAASFQG